MQGSINFDGSLVGNITGGGGGGGDTVVITPVVTSGTKIADVSVNGVEKDLYCPTPPTPPQIDITPVQESGTKIADVSLDGVEKDLYAPNPTTVNVTQVQQSGTKIATIGVNGQNTDIYAPEGVGGIIYSLTEHIVGKWLDGKPLYQKTITISSKQSQIDISSLNIDTYVKSESVYRVGSYCFDIPRLSDSTQNYNNYISTYYTDLSSGNINFIWGSSVTSIDELHLTIQYTKTTDQVI